MVLPIKFLYTIFNMLEKQAFLFIQKALDKANQKGAFTLAESANIVAALEQLNNFINADEEKVEEN